MKIRYQPRFGGQTVEIRDITGGDELAMWTAGQEREVEGRSVLFRSPGGQITSLPAATALLSCGPDFVDARTGKNPNFICSQCGDPALSEHFTDRFTLDVVHFTDDDRAGSPRQCLACWLSRHTERIPEFRRMQCSEDTLARAQALAANRSSAASAPAKAPSSKPAAAPDASVSSEE